MSPGDPNRPSLRSQVYRGVGWSLLQTWGSRFITFAVFLVLARLLGPQDFGVVTTAYVIVGALTMLVDLGVTDALVRRQNSDDSYYDTVFWVILGVSFVIWGVLAAAAPAIAVLFKQPPLTPLLWTLGAMLPMTALSRAHEARLRSTLNFKPLAMRTLGASVISGVVGIGLALAGFGYWSLMWKGLVESAAGTALLWRSSSYRPGRQFVWAHWNELFRVARPLLGSRLIDIVNQRLDALIVSNRLGPAALGVYAAGQRIHQTMMEALFASINRVTLPAFAKLQHDDERTRSALLRVVALASFFTFPLFALMGVFAESVVLLLFGRPWIGSAPILAAFCAGGVLYSVSHFNAPLMTARGRTDFVFRLMLINVTVNAVGFIVAVQWGAVAVAIAWSLRGYVVLPVNLRLLRHTIGLGAAPYLRNLLPSALVTLALVATILALRWLGGPALAETSHSLLLAVGAGALYPFAMLLLFPARCELVAQELESLLPRAPKMSARIARYRDWLQRRRGGR